MAFQKGISGNPKGRKPGTKNTRSVQARITSLLNDNFNLIEQQMSVAPNEVKTEILLTLLATVKTT
jgi:hypothetical protein